MSLPINIKDLITGSVVEWERLEFKGGWNPNEIMHTITAYANDINNWGGGYVLIGVEEENGRPVLPPKGIDKDSIDKIQKELLNYCYQIKPNYFPIVEPIRVHNRNILVI
ncbi:MAG: ATP-binding protein [Tindallia sp. MSAO_Bac2]|nr:MAG: ATP-binding protein [Tindallia sp. MSAO_Bac2]